MSHANHANHVDGEIWAQPKISTKSLGELAGPVRAVDADRVPVEPTDLDYRTAALNAAALLFTTTPVASTSYWGSVKAFEHYLRTGEAA